MNVLYHNVKYNLGHIKLILLNNSHCARTACLVNTWFLYYMVAQLTMRTHGVNQAFRFVEGIWLHRKSHQIRYLFF